MDEGLKDAIKEVCAAFAVNIYQATRISPARTQKEMDQAKLNVKAHIRVEEEGEGVLVHFPMMEIIKVPPFYGMIVSVVMTEKFKRSCNEFFIKSPVLQGRRFYYTY